MNGRIVILSEDLSKKIAAGEVIERPASIVKELLENALDAGATAITVELQGGGKEFIRVIDNGEGMDRENASVAFERHATSKIGTFEDLYRVQTFGFRGEALPSIAAVARVELLTKVADAVAGTRVIMEAGRTREVADTGCPAGTSISVSRIFDEVPVRKNFLKKDATEQGHCIDVISRIALAHPGVRVTVIANGKRLIDIPGTGNLGHRAAVLLGPDFKDNLIPLRRLSGGIGVKGLISSPNVTRSSSRNMFFYVNRRYVRDPVISHAVMNAYRKLMEDKKYPSVVLFLEVDPGEVDVNVHPAKLEIRFRNPGEVHDTVTEAVTEALSRLTPVSAEAASPAGEVPGEIREKHRVGVAEALRRYSIYTGLDKRVFESARGGAQKSPPLAEAPADPGLFGDIPAQEERVSFSSLDYLGPVSGTYLLFASPGGFVVLDQHAAHERVLYEKMKQWASRGKPVSQRLLLPEVVHFAPKDYANIMDCLPVLRGAGMEIEPFGGDAFVVKAVPSLLAKADPKTLLRDMAGDMGEHGAPQGVVDLQERILTFMACRSAVKAGQTLSEKEVAELLKDMDSFPFPSNCPHGRPVFIQFTLRDLEKMFKRT